MATSAQMTRYQKGVASKSSLKAFAGERDGLRIIAACGSRAEFRKIAKLSSFSVEGETTNPLEKSIAFIAPRTPFCRPTRQILANWSVLEVPGTQEGTRQK